MTQPTLIAFDADDTLWHSEDSFHAGEMKFVELISPYAAEGIDVKAALTAVERKNLHAFGYGVKAFGLSAVEAAVSITDGDKVGMSLQFDANKLWTATATGFHFEDGDAGLEFTINRSEANRFAYEFESSSQLRIRFDSGLPQWVMGLQGTMAVSTAFKGCIRNLQ